MLGLIKAALLAMAALLAAGIACAICVSLYPAFGFPLFALACAVLIWMITAGLAIPVAIFDPERDWVALSIVPLSLILVCVYSDFMLYLASSWGIALDQFSAAMFGLGTRALSYGLPLAPGPAPVAHGSALAVPLAWIAGSGWKAALGGVSGVLAGLVLRSR
jgi:hypothetical protein